MIKNVLLAMTLCCAALSGAEVILSQDGQSEYVIVLPETASKTDRFAAKELKEHLDAAIGADFRIGEKPGRKNIVLGKAEAVAGAEDDSSYTVEIGETDILLYGGGKSGTLYAVYEFLEGELGCRWFGAYAGQTLIPKQATLKLQPKKRSGKYSFPVRGTQTFFYKDKKSAAYYHYRNRQNILLPEVDNVENFLPEFNPKVHVLSDYINPGIRHSYEHRMHKQLDWIENRSYFTTNPEYFPMDKDGQRVPQGQLCFSNAELRKELTRLVLINLEREQKRLNTVPGILTLDMNDVVYEKFCWCPDCQKLEKKYQSPAGAYWEYLSDFCRDLKKSNPEVLVRASAYLTTITPPAKLEIPDNLIIIFAPIYSNMIAPLNHPTNKNTMEQLKTWLAKDIRVWYWHYPLTFLEKSPYTVVPPLANIHRIVEDIKEMKKLGVNGTYFEHDSGGITERTNFTELQSWLMLQCFKDCDQDVDGLIKEFTDFQYGKAAPLVRRYLYEVEEENLKMLRENIVVRYNVTDFPYLTPERVKHWQELCSQMEKLVEDQPEHLAHVKLLRRGLDAVAKVKLAEDGNK